MISLYGYRATGISQILKEANVPKGSFYHYFESKEDFGLAIIDRYVEGYDQKIKRFLLDKTISPLDRIRNYLLDGQKWFRENKYERGCLIGSLGQELSNQSEQLRIRLDEVFINWKKLLASCIKEAQKEKQLSTQLNATAIAEFILSGWEGAILRGRVTKSYKPLEEFTQVLFSTVLNSKL